MKKVFLIIALIFASNNLVNAKTSEVVYFDDCAEAAWNYGTRMATGIYDNNAYIQYYFTEQFYNDYCA